MLYENPELMERLIFNFSNYVFWKDKQGFFRGCNNNFATLIGLESPSKIIGQTDSTLPLMKNLASLNLPDKQCLHTGNPIPAEKFDLDIQGERRCFLLEKNFIYDKNNQVIGTVGVIRDITCQEKLNASLKQAVHLQKSYIADVNKKVTGQEHRDMSVEEYTDEIRYHLENIIATMPGNIYWLNRECILLGGNDNLAKMFGLKSRSELAGLTYDQMAELAQWTEGQGESFKSAELEVMATGIPRFNVEEPPVTINGETRYYMSNKVPLYNKENKIIGVVGISIDITDRKIAEEREKAALLESSQAKARADAEEQLRQAVMILTGSIVHDLRTPISSLEMNGGFLENYLPILINGYEKAKIAQPSIEGDKEIPARMKNHLATMGKNIQETAREMHGFIDTTLKTLSKVVSGNLTQKDLIVCSMWHCLHNTLQRYPFSDQQRKLVTWDQRDFNFMGNELLMIRIFFNLIKNSLEQIEKNKSGEIFITTEVQDDRNIICFKDTAGGAPPEIADNLFSGYSATKEKGTGVGLAFCKVTMENFGGSITCNSVYGKYIEFILSFPLVNPL
jgi:two-component system aerobic respiration control sensor histidine kinase ArcB